MKPLRNTPQFSRRGIRLHDPNLDQLAAKEGLPISPYNVPKAAQADIESVPDQLERDPQQRIKRYGGNYETPD